MPATTPNLGIPYPLDSDNQSAFPALAKTAAERLDSLIQRGSVSVTVAANTTISTHVTFPEPFAETPTVVLTPETANPGPIALAHANLGLTGFDVRTNSTNAQTFKVYWIAIA
jgi:DNA-binding transcriptional regulator LsrR (DeoR family)